MFKTMLTTIVRAIEMFRVANGMVLMMVVEAFDGGGSGVDRRENLAKISDPTLWEGGVVIQMVNNKDKKNNHDTARLKYKGNSRLKYKGNETQIQRQ